MAAGRGLNKGRGLGSLIPPKTDAVDAAQIKEQGIAKNGKNSIEEGKTARARNKTAAETGKPATTGKRAALGSGKPANSAREEAASAGNARKNKIEAAADEVTYVRLTQVVPNREQPRKRFEESGLEELSASILEHGIVTPLLVRKKGKYYELIAGERRWRAAKMAGLKEVPVLLREFSEQQAAEIALIENIQRENLNAMEEAQAFKRLQEEFSLKQEDIAKRVSRSRSAITNALRLLKLEEHVQTMLAEGKLSMGHARALLSLESLELQKITAERIAENDLSVRETEKLVKKLLTPKKTREKPETDEKFETACHDLEEQLRKSIGTRVSIQPIRGNKGKIEIEYYSNEDLERIVDRIRQD